MKLSVYIPILYCLFTVHGVSQNHVEKLLWQSVNISKKDICKRYILDKKVEDLKNGYLKVSGYQDASCCGFAKAVAVFKTSKNRYVTLVRNEAERCNFTYSIETNNNLIEILPKELRISSFIPKGDASLFYFDIEPPQKGTDVAVNLKPVPFGIKNTNKNPFNHEINEGIEDFSFFRDFVLKLKDSSTLKSVLEKKFNTIDKEELSLITDKIGKNNPNYSDWNLDIVSAKLHKLYKIYQDFEARKYDAFVLGWNKDVGKFYIKEKVNKQKSISFYQFLKDNKFWEAIC